LRGDVVNVARFQTKPVSDWADTYLKRATGTQDHVNSGATGARDARNNGVRNGAVVANGCAVDIEGEYPNTTERRDEGRGFRHDGSMPSPLDVTTPNEGLAT
jgi:hypothetical protein